jgi:1-acyl-sn-glycerol-3-phosphate acyltransferase
VTDWKYQPAGDLGLTHAERVQSLKREGGLAEGVVHILWWSLVRAYLAVGHRLTVKHAERLPTAPPFILIANHSSHLDTLSMMAPLPWRVRERTHPIAAGDTFFESVATGTFAAFALNALPLWRKKCDPRDVKALRERMLGMPCGYVLFPEGTRSRTGEMAKFKRGLGVLVAGTDVPVYPCRLDGAFEALPSNRKLPSFGRVTLTIGEPLRFAAVSNDGDGWSRIAREAEEAVRRV